MKNKTWERLGVLLIITTFSIGVLGMEKDKTKFKQYQPYKATSEEVDMSNMPKLVVYDRDFEKPSDEKMEELVLKALDMAEKEENRIRHIMAKKIVPVTCWNMMCSGSVLVEAEKTRYSFTFKGSTTNIQQFNGYVYKDRIGGTRNLDEEIFILFHNDTDCIKSFTYGSDISLGFYPCNKLEGFSFSESGKHYIARWDEEGKILEQKISEIEMLK